MMERDGAARSLIRGNDLNTSSPRAARYGVRRQSGAATALSERPTLVINLRASAGKAMSRYACHRTPKIAHGSASSYMD
jgi:hypothetical protein